VVPVSAIIITRNESAHIADALASVAWADERIVVDSRSTDDTVEIARRFTDRVIVRDWEGYIPQKNYAAGVACHDWIVSIDADERVTEPLAAEIRTLLGSNPALGGYQMPRVSFYLGKWLRSTDWYPDYQVRLYNRRVARWTGRYVHESVAVDGPVGRLRGELLHYPYRDISHHLATIDRYTTLAARQMHEDGRRARVADVAVRPPLAFLRNYVLRRGVKDGSVGFLVSMLNSYYVLLKFAKLWELGRAGRQGDAVSPEP
jgi:glycosyltransferase involved in cell wall biosynthesis